MKKSLFKPFVYGAFKVLSRLDTTFFSESIVACGYLLKNQSFYNKCSAPVIAKDRFQLHEILGTQYIKPAEKVHYMEFGVRWGQIINRWASYNTNPESTFVGFDTFTGIPEAWGTVKAGSFSNQGSVPKPQDERVQFLKGLVQDTLPAHIKRIDVSKRLVMHLDFDIYSATLFTLVVMQPLMKKGDVLIFDEFFSLTKNHHEYRAFLDFLAYHKVQFKPVHKWLQGQFVIELI